VLEYFVHLHQDDLPDDLVLASAEAPEGLHASASISKICP